MTNLTNTPSPTDEDRELIGRLRLLANGGRFPAVPVLIEAGLRLESLLSDRAKLEGALQKISIGEVGGSDPFESYMLLRKLALDALNRSTDHTP